MIPEIFLKIFSYIGNDGYLHTTMLINKYTNKNIYQNIYKILYIYSKNATACTLLKFKNLTNLALCCYNNFNINKLQKFNNLEHLSFICMSVPVINKPVLEKIKYLDISGSTMHPNNLKYAKKLIYIAPSAYLQLYNPIKLLDYNNLICLDLRNCHIFTPLFINKHIELLIIPCDIKMFIKDLNKFSNIQYIYIKNIPITNTDNKYSKLFTFNEIKKIIKNIPFMNKHYYISACFLYNNIYEPTNPETMQKLDYYRRMNYL